MSTNVASPERKRVSAGRIVLIAVGGLIALNIALGTADRWVGGARPGPDSSTYTTAPNGVAAYADLLADVGHDVVRLRAAVDEAPLEPASTVVVIDAELEPDEVTALRTFVFSGGRLVVIGGSPWVSGVVDRPPVWSRGLSGRTRPIAPVPEVAGVADVHSSGPGVFTDGGSTLPALAGERGALLTVTSLGDGRVALLATAAPLRNDLLDNADNAALGIALAGEASRPVVFYEAPHGFGQGGGFGAIPSRARWVMAGLTLAALLWMAGRARRLGPPEDNSRPLAPPRRLYVSSLAGTLARTKRRAESVAPLQHHARRRLQLIGGLAHGAGLKEWQDAAAHLGLNEAETAALLSEPADDHAVVEVGRVFNKLERIDR